MSLSRNEPLKFEELGSVQNSFIWLSHRVTKLLEKENFPILKLTCNKIVTDGQFPKYFCSKIQSCGDDTIELLSILTMSPYWKWIDFRLMETVAAISAEAVNLIKQYQKYLYPQNLVDHLSLIPPVREDDNSNCKVMKVKIQATIDNITIKSFCDYRHFLETEILNLKEGACILKYIQKESFMIDWLIPNELCLDAHKSAKRNCEKFHKIFLLFVHIESFEAIFQVCTYVCGIST